MRSCTFLLIFLSSCNLRLDRKFSIWYWTPFSITYIGYHTFKHETKFKRPKTKIHYQIVNSSISSPPQWAPQAHSEYLRNKKLSNRRSNTSSKKYVCKSTTHWLRECHNCLLNYQHIHHRRWSIFIFVQLIDDWLYSIIWKKKKKNKRINIEMEIFPRKSNIKTH